MHTSTLKNTIYKAKAKNKNISFTLNKKIYKSPVQIYLASDFLCLEGVIWHDPSRKPNQ